jgi:O-antigen/teichoic acid export membrane protein
VLSLPSVASFVRTVVTAKILAVALGPSLVGVLSQLLNLSSFLLTIIPLGLTIGVAKVVAESRTQPDRMNRVVGTSALISVVSAAGLLVLMAPFSPQISVVLTGSTRYDLLVLLTLATLPLYNLAGVLSYVLQGLSDTWRFTWANVGTAGGTLAVLVPLALRYGLTGAVLGILAGSLVQLVLFVFAVMRAYRQQGWSIGGVRFGAMEARTLLGYGSILLIAGIGMWGSTLLVRTLAVRGLGEFQNGIYQVAFGLSFQYITVFMTWMGVHVFPRVATEHAPGELAGLLNSTLRANLLLMAPVLVLTVALRDPLIRIFFSDAFLSAAPLIPLQALGDYARIIGWSFGVGLFAQGRTRAYLVPILLQSAAWIALSGATLSALGIRAVALGYALSYLLWPMAMFPLVQRLLGVRIDGGNVLLVTVGLAALAGAVVLPLPLGVLLAAAVPAAVWLRRRVAGS